MTDLYPPIIISETDFDHLSHLANTRGRAHSEAMDFLERELDRADVVPDTHLPGDVVRLQSRVTYNDLVTGHQRTVTLAYPGDQDIDKGRISVLTPIGAALLGLRPGQRIAWRSWSETARALEVLAVDPARP